MKVAVAEEGVEEAAIFVASAGTGTGGTGTERVGSEVASPPAVKETVRYKISSDWCQPMEPS